MEHPTPDSESELVRDEEPGLRRAPLAKKTRQIIGHLVSSGGVITPTGIKPTVTLDIQHISLLPPAGPVKNFVAVISAENARYLAVVLIEAADRADADVEAGLTG